MKTKNTHPDYASLLRESTTENGCICFHNIDQPLVTALCEIIGALHRELEAKGMTEAQIADLMKFLP